MSLGGIMGDLGDIMEDIMGTQGESWGHHEGVGAIETYPSTITVPKHTVWVWLHSKRPHFPNMPGHIFPQSVKTHHFCSDPISIRAAIRQ